MRSIALSLIALTCFSFSAVTYSQDSPVLHKNNAESNAKLNGTIKDKEGHPIADATIMIWPNSDQYYQSAKDGSFEISNIPKHDFALIITAWGYHPFIREQIHIHPEQIPRIDIVLIKNTIETAPLIFDRPTNDEVAAYQPILTAFKEPPFLSTDTPTKLIESYRFLWIRSFDPYVLIHLRILDDSNAIVTYKELDQNQDRSKFKLTVNKTENLNKIMSKEIKRYDLSVVKDMISAVRMSAEENFWNQPYRVDDGSIVLDGSDCIVEGYRSAGYHLVTRWSPIQREEDPISHFLHMLIQASGKRFFYDEVY